MTFGFVMLASVAALALVFENFHAKFARFSTGKLRDFGFERAVRMQKTCAGAKVGNLILSYELKF